MAEEVDGLALEAESLVMNSHRELQRAMEDFRAGRLGTIPADGR
ncbi:hypothetical protein ACFVUN_27195 [Kitasatospora griseola]